MRWLELHPGSRILLYLLSALAVPGLNFFELALMALVIAGMGLDRLVQMFGLVWRTRWLLLLLPLTYAYSLPGEALHAGLGAWSPSREGLAQGLLQVARLGLLLLLLDLLVLRLPAAELLAGIHSVLRPLSLFGLDRDRATLRLALTMEAMREPRGFKETWARLSTPPPQETVDGEYVLTLRPYRLPDWGMLILSSLGVMWLYA